VFSIAREALTNVRKHARAHRVSLAIALEREELVLRILDDGVGFDADVLTIGPERWPHFGLAGMRERAESVGGSIVWRSRAGSGVEVELRVPVGGGSSNIGSDDLASPGEIQRSTGQHQAVRSPAGYTSEAD
jgi:signal transduction histidine kinase